MLNFRPEEIKLDLSAFDEKIRGTIAVRLPKTYPHGDSIPRIQQNCASYFILLTTSRELPDSWRICFESSALKLALYQSIIDNLAHKQQKKFQNVTYL